MELARDTFAGRIGERFAATPADGEPVELVLARCDDASPGFSLLFHAPDLRLVPQQTFRVEHAQLGDFPMFLVPLGPDEQGMRYEAVFG
jgi:hypothetical protein